MSDQHAAPTFDPAADHQQKPKLRKVRGFPLPVQGPEGKQLMMLGLADAQQISDKIVATQPASQAILPLMDGSRSIDDLVKEVGRGLTREFLEPFVAQLDSAGLIEGPTFAGMLEEMKARFDESDTLPPGVTAQVADQLVMAKHGQDATDEQKAEHGAEELRTMLDAWIDAALKDAEDPSFDTLPAAVVAPHIDYPRGWINYANIYGRLRVVDRPDRIVILGTNHFGSATGVCGCDKGYESPLGVSPFDGALVDALKSRLGDAGSAALFEHRYDHEREHSIELHIPWIQHCIGAGDDGSHVPVFAALIHDPTVNSGESYDGNGLALDPFLDALRAALDQVGGTTLVISSADLSHVGPAFGDQIALAGDDEAVKSERERVTSHDREMLNLVINNQPDDLIASMTWQQNPTRWCSIGNLVATMRLVEPSSIRQVGYAAAVDQRGTAMVSHAALAMS
jgi:AmmeMemoRadiSam system protein B